MEVAPDRSTCARVSVIVTCYNQAHWIETALDSVRRQTEQSLQLVITDDGSDDGSPRVIADWVAGNWPNADFIAVDRNVGLPAVLNLAAERLAGEYVVVLNGDDWMDAERVERQAQFFDQQPGEVGVVYGRWVDVDEAGRPTGGGGPKPKNIREGRILHDLIGDIALGMPTLMFRREVLSEVGRWDETLVADDFDFLLRVAEAGFEFRYLPEVLINYRVNSGSLTNSRQADLIDSRIRVIKRFVGSGKSTNDVALQRLDGLAVALHGSGYDRKAVRRHLWFVARRRPTRRLARCLVENQLHLRPGGLRPPVRRS